jgi:hypothetical protein
MWGLERHQRFRCAPYYSLLGDSGSSRRIASGNLKRSGLGVEHCFNWISMAGRQRAVLQLSTATVRNGCERPFLGAVELRASADRGLALLARGR